MSLILPDTLEYHQCLLKKGMLDDVTLSEIFVTLHLSLSQCVIVRYLIFVTLCLSVSLSLSVKQRLSTVEGMSCAEFLYPIFQAYDFLQLHTHHRCWIQVGKIVSLSIINF